jgi:nucleotide-binding universal stress UspA family protein
MSKTILLAVDAARSQSPDRHVHAAADMIKDLASDTGDRVVVLHVHEFAVGRTGRVQIDCIEGEGEKLVSEIVGSLHQAGLEAESVIRNADYGHVARVILAVANDVDARLLALGSRSRTDLPHVPFGSVSSRLLHLARRPVLIVPMQTAGRAHEDAQSAGAAGAGTGG